MNVTHLNRETFPHTGPWKNCFPWTGPWCQKDWGPCPREFIFALLGVFYSSFFANKLASSFPKKMETITWRLACLPTENFYQLTSLCPHLTFPPHVMGRAISVQLSKASPSGCTEFHPLLSTQEVNFCNYSTFYCNFQARKKSLFAPTSPYGHRLFSASLFNRTPSKGCQCFPCPRPQHWPRPLCNPLQLSSVSFSPSKCLMSRTPAASLLPNPRFCSLSSSYSNSQQHSPQPSALITALSTCSSSFSQLTGHSSISWASSPSSLCNRDRTPASLFSSCTLSTCI